jgi:hypothetical protein
MSEIRNLTRNGETFYPLTHSSAVIWNSGTTTERPTSGVMVGMIYFDTTLGKPIWAKTVSGSTITWVDANGQTV